MDTEEIIDDDENVDIEDKIPFSWKKVLLAPFKALWCVIAFLAKVVWWLTRFTLKTAWWGTKLFLFFAVIGLGIFAVLGAVFQSVGGNQLGASKINEDKYEWVNGRRVLVEKRISSRLFGLAGRIWRSLWGGGSAEE